MLFYVGEYFNWSVAPISSISSIFLFDNMEQDEVSELFLSSFFPFPTKAETLLLEWQQSI